jgi:hypothetical protein
MEILPTQPEDFAGAAQAVELQANLLKKSQDMKSQEVSSLLAALPRPASLQHQAKNIDVSA